jgi:hypothetical protein
VPHFAVIAFELNQGALLACHLSIAAVAIGFVLAFWGDEFLPGVLYNTLPLPVVAGVGAAILYGLAAIFWPPSQATVPAVAAASQSPAAQ